LDPALIEKAEAYGLTESGCSFFDAVEIIKKVAGSDAYVQAVETALGNIVSGGRNFQLEVDAQNETFTLSYDFDPNKEMGYTFTLSWEWAFENGETAEEIALYDAADTYLGNVAAGVIEVIPEGVSVAIGATVIGTSTQID
ncbi:MAG: hypothetical protein J6S70_02410, partial [Clostridia bacterium]|nr:hypothetical protein [Clostridia bacterium]